MAQHYCASWHLVEKKVKKGEKKVKKKTFEIKKNRSGSVRGIEPATFSFRTNFTATGTVREILITHLLTNLYWLNASKLKKCKGNLLMLFLKYFQLIQVFPCKNLRLIAITYQIIIARRNVQFSLLETLHENAFVFSHSWARNIFMYSVNWIIVNYEGHRMRKENAIRRLLRQRDKENTLIPTEETKLKPLRHCHLKDAEITGILSED